jgi:hypothetical protein
MLISERKLQKFIAASWKEHTVIMNLVDNGKNYLSNGHWLMATTDIHQDTLIKAGKNNFRTNEHVRIDLGTKTTIGDGPLECMKNYESLKTSSASFLEKYGLLIKLFDDEDSEFYEVTHNGPDSTEESMLVNSAYVDAFAEMLGLTRKTLTVEVGYTNDVPVLVLKCSSAVLFVMPRRKD